MVTLPLHNDIYQGPVAPGVRYKSDLDGQAKEVFVFSVF